jgi:hypothetical protein
MGGVFLGFQGCASGGAGEAGELPAVGLVVVVVGDGLRLRGTTMRRPSPWRTSGIAQALA